MKKTRITFPANFFFFFLYIHAISVQAQWVALPIPEKEIILNYPTSSIPDIIIPYANGKIIYTSKFYGTPQQGRPGKIYNSTDDLQSKSLVFETQGGFGTNGFYKLDCFNDSTFSFYITTSGFKGLHLTTNNFLSVKSVSNTFFPSDVDASALTNKYYYAFSNSQVHKCKLDATGNTYYSLSGLIPVSDRMYFKNDSVGYTLVKSTSNQAKTSLIKTVNYGANWTVLKVDSLDSFVNLQLSNQGYLYLLKKSGSISVSIDQGSTWTTLAQPPSDTYNSICFSNALTGLIGGSGGLLMKTVDGGISWIQETSNCVNTISRIYIYNQTGYFVDNTNRVYKSQHPVIIPENNNSRQTKIYPNPANDLLNLSLEDWKNSESVNLKLFTVLGSELVSKDISSADTQIDLSNYPAGVYFLYINRDGFVQRLKVQKTE
jgi:hypothetical protein